MTKEYIDLRGPNELKEKQRKFPGQYIKIVLPNMTFKKNLTFEAEGVEFFSSPEHTSASSSCYDQGDKVLFVGDKDEAPDPLFEKDCNFSAYLQTLEYYKTLGTEKLVMSRGGQTDIGIFENNLQYIRELENENKGTAYFDNCLLNAGFYYGLQCFFCLSGDN